MARSFHRFARLSTTALVAVTLASPALAGNAYGGRWTVADDKPVFSSRGQSYRTIDIAPCGKDFCGVSVGSNGSCGPVLFRFLARSVAGDDGLRGHGRWGQQKKNIEIYAYGDGDTRGMTVNLGDGYDFGERSGNMPKFSASYRPLGNARCKAR
jgi:hypothetical protein